VDKNQQSIWLDELPERHSCHLASSDLFRDENIRYAQGLMAAGIAVELTVYPGACHGFQLIPKTIAGGVYFQAHQDALARALGIPS